VVAVKEGEPSAGVERLRARIARRFSTVEAEQLTTFASELFARDGEAYAGTLDDDELMAVVGGAAGFLGAAGEFPRVRVFDPQRGTEGWEPGRTIIEACVPDGPFVVGVVRAHLHRERFVIRQVLHPVFSTERERDGGLIGLRPRSGDGRRECFMHIAIDPIRDPATRARLQASLEGGLRLASLATRDQRAIRERIEAMAQDLDWVAGLPAVRSRASEAKEAVSFLRWLSGGNFVALGYREMGVDERPSGVGLYLVPEAHLGVGGHVDDVAQARDPDVVGTAILTIAPSAGDNPVVPGTRFDRVAVQRLAPDGRVIGEGWFVGCFTPIALAQDPCEIPVLRLLLSYVLEAEAAVAGSHEHEEILALFRSFPKDTLFRSEPVHLHEDMRAILSAPPDAVAISTREVLTDHGRRLLAIVNIPTAELSDRARQSVLDRLVARTHGTLVCVHTVAAGPDRTCIHAAVDVPFRDRDPGDDLGSVAWTAEITRIVRPWGDRLIEHLGTDDASADARRIVTCLGDAFAAKQRRAADFDTTIQHLEAIRELERSHRPIARITNPTSTDGGQHTLVQTYRFGDALPLSEGLAALGSFGLQVVAEESLNVVLPGGAHVQIRTFRVRDDRGRHLDVDRVGGRLQEALLAVEAGQAEHDTLNALVVSTDLDYHAVHCLRTLGGYAAELGLAPDRVVIQGALRDSPVAAQALFNFFRARFRPDSDDDGETFRVAFEAHVGDVERPADARILAALGAIVGATVRTNFFRADADTQSYIAIKVQPATLDRADGPRPESEIYVHSRHMEGLFLQAGRVTRGRITAWDRHERLRDRLLDALIEQDLKNAMTVCVGGAGGFVVKGELTEQASRLAYEMLIRGILDLTDNRVAGRVESPRNVRVYDAEESHLVIADDPDGPFGGIANTIAQEYGLWLGDAFASSSLDAYDARRLGIAARGAWECVRSHLRDAGRVVDDPIVVVGTGDMTDEFFGNAMLQSPTIRLRAAVSPRYVFLDPDPDPERSFVERRRLAASGLGWDAYDASKLSPGGMVLPRSTERVQPSPEVRASLGLGDRELSGEALAAAAVCAQADVLWSGSGSRSAAAGIEAIGSVDTAVTARVEGRELRATVVAEGGGGLSQRSRVDYALSGGCINTSVIDSVGEDDLADHEVSLKLLSQPLLEAGILSQVERDQLLRETAGSTAAGVVSRIHAQHRALTFDQERSRSCIEEFSDAAQWLAGDSWVARTLASLPDRAALQTRRGRYRGLTRPELGLLLTCTKIVIKRRLRGAVDLLDSALCEPFLRGFLPSDVRSRFADAVGEHPLRREIVAAEIVNRLVDTFGSTFVYRVARDADADVVQVIRAWTIAFHLVGGQGIVDAVLPPSSRAGPVGEAALHVQRVLTDSVERLTRWLLVNAADEKSPWDVARELEAVIGETQAVLPGYFSAGEAERFHGQVTELEMADLGADVARQLALTEWFDTVLEVHRIATATGVGWEAAARHWYGVSGWIDFPWLLARIADLDASDVWQHRAACGLVHDVTRARRLVVRRLSAAGAATPGAAGSGIPWAGADRVLSLMADIKAAPQVTLVALHVVVRELAHLSAAGQEDV
jgi:glutamate dehydrogenase